MCLAGFENPLGALPVCVVMLKHTNETPESQQSSNFLSKSHLSIKGVAENQESKTLGNDEIRDNVPTSPIVQGVIIGHPIGGSISFAGHLFA